MRRIVLAAAVGFLAACALDRRGLPAAHDDATSPSLDAGPDGAPGPVDAGPDAHGDAGECVTGSPATCADDSLAECVDGGVRRTPCALGCSVSADTCRRIVPSNVGGEISIDDGSASLVVESGEVLVFDSSTGRIDVREQADPSVVVRTVRTPGSGVLNGIAFGVGATGTPLPGVFALGSLEVSSSAIATCRGDRPLVLLLRSIGVDGVLTVGASADAPGCGGYAGGADSDGSGPGGGQAGGSMSRDDSGGGGGGFGSVGGPGWSGAGGGGRGITYGSASLVPLQGGSGGGSGGAAGGRGGHGGGALQVTASEQIRVGPSGLIDASGNGGGGGVGDATDAGGAGGGGAGGAVLLEAPSVIVEGVVGAVGAPGGQGAICSTVPSCDGGDGPDAIASRAPVTGFSTRGTGGGAGFGSGLDGVAGAGRAGENGGGGGGGAGRVRISTAGGTETYPGHIVPTEASGIASVHVVERTP